MFGLLNASQIYGLQRTETTTINNNSPTTATIVTSTTTVNNSNKNNRQLSKLARNGSSGGIGGGGGGGGVGVGATLAHHLQGMKVPANFIEKLIKSELLTGYEAVKQFKNFHHSTRHHHQALHHPGSNLKSIDCDNLHGNYRSGNFADEDVNSQLEMTVIKYPNDIQQHQHHHPHHHHHHHTPGTDMEVINSTTTSSIGGSSILRTIDGSTLQREDSLNGNSNEMISDQSSSTKSNDPSSSSSADSPETERKTSPTAAGSPERVQRRKLMQMITFLDQQNQRMQKELAKEKRRRTEELSRIIKSLICMESKLKIDKKQINQRLLDKDTEICRLVSLNRALRKKFNENKENCRTTTLTEAECLVLEALQCTSCKQKFYAIDTKENWTQTSKDGRKSNDDPTTELGSSSDDTVSSSFYGARRSVRYTSKRTFGTFRDYMRSRAMNIDDPNLDNSEENASTISRDDSHNSYEKMNIYSRAIDRLHGVRRVSSTEGDLDSEYDNSSSRKNQSHSSGIEEDDLLSPPEDDRAFSSPKSDKMELSPCNSKSNSLSRSIDFSEASPKQEFETSTDDWYASASDGEEESESVRTKSYGYNVAVNPVLECVNQILLQQSMEESMNDSQPTSLEGNDTPHLSSSQRGGRQSRSSSNGSTKDQGNTGTISRKRVHFSTKNSMVHVPRDDDDHDHDMHMIPSPMSSPSASVIADQIKDNILNYESIYSNEYEPIGSENNSSNLYVDMESKLSPEERTNFENKPPKQPPALPPKPANLIKFKKALKITVPQLHFDESEEQGAADDASIMSEPDYCSISEVNVAITNVQVIADVHKEPDLDSSTEMDSLRSDTQSMKTDDIEEIFADIPKLPNVAAIIAPKTPPSNTINYLTQSRDAEVVSKLQRSPRQFKRKHVPNILAEINKRMNNSNPTTPTKIPNGILTMATPPKKATTPIIKLSLASSPIVEDKQLPLQAEFDWYNLDAEYGKSSSNQPDIIRASDVISIDENEDGPMGLHGVEYNLDEEFSLAGGNQPDIIKENHSESPKTINGISTSPKTVCEDFPIITEVTPCLKKIKKTANFDTFIDSSGLSTKPLPRQRKIYFDGPFV